MASLNKLKNVELSDGWSFVTRGKGGKRPAKRNTKPKAPRSGDDEQVDASVVQKLIHDLESINSHIEGMSNVMTLISSLRRDVTEKSSSFCLGLGSLHADSSANQKRSMAQFAVYLALHDASIPQRQEDIICHAIDPSFTATDQEVMKHFGVQSRRDGDEVRMSEKSNVLCYAPYLPWPVLLIDYSIQLRSPEILICQDLSAVAENLEMWFKQTQDVVTIEVEGRECKRSDIEMGLSVCRDILRRYDATRFPTYEPLPDAFRDLLVYTRKDSDD